MRGQLQSGSRRLNRHWQSGHSGWTYTNYGNVRFQGLMKDGEPYIFPLSWADKQAQFGDNWQTYGIANERYRNSQGVELCRANVFGVDGESIIEGLEQIGAYCLIYTGTDAPRYQYMEIYEPVTTTIEPIKSRVRDNVASTVFDMPMTSAPATFTHFKYDKKQKAFVGAESGIYQAGLAADAVTVTLDTVNEIGILALKQAKFYIKLTPAESNDRGYEEFDTREKHGRLETPLGQLRYKGERFIDYYPIKLKNLEPLCNGQVMYDRASTDEMQAVSSWNLQTPVCVGQSGAWATKPMSAVAQGYEVRYLHRTQATDDISQYIPYVYIAGGYDVITQNVVADGCMRYNSRETGGKIARTYALTPMYDTRTRIRAISKPIGVEYLHGVPLGVVETEKKE